jgi:uncharacterized protein (TIGR02452 family)
MWDGFYQPHRDAHDPIHNDDIIYTPGVTVFKTDTAMPELMPESDWYDVDVITCAAPNLRNQPSNKYNTGDGNKQTVMKDKDLLALIQYIAEEDKVQKVLENQSVLRLPIVRNGRQATVGYQPDVWKGWR